jgi:hypothetical protein
MSVRGSVWVRHEAAEAVARGEAVSAGAVCVVLGMSEREVDAVTWGGVRGVVWSNIFHDLWRRSPRSDIRAGRTIPLLGDDRFQDLHLSPGPAHVFVLQWYAIADVRRALAVLGLRLGKVLKRGPYGPPGRFRFRAATWTVRGRFREPASRLDG